MLLIVGLGNPGEKYNKTRHNAGFIVIDEIQKSFGFPEFTANKKFNAEISEDLSLFSENSSKAGFFGKLFSGDKKDKIILAKPQTFMNRSGESVRKIMDYYKIKVEDIIIISDDLDIIIGKYKVAIDSSAAGHNGIQSVINNIGTQKFKRIKVGVEKKEGRQARKTPGVKFVLENFSEEEYQIIQRLSESIKKDLLN